MKNNISPRKYTIIAFLVAILATLIGLSQTFGLKVWPMMHVVLWFPIVVISNVSDIGISILLSFIQFPLLAAGFAIAIRRKPPLLTAAAIGVLYALLICVAFVMAYPDLRWRYRDFTRHDKEYYGEIANGCDILLSHTNTTTDWWVLDGDDKSLPSTLLDLRSTRIQVAKHQEMTGTNFLTAVIIVFGERRPDFVVSWQQNDYGNGYRPWELSIISGGEPKVVFATTNLNDSIAKKDNEKADAELVAALANLPVVGPSTGPPMMGISSNATTEAVARKGHEIVPELISALDHSSWKQTVWIVFCLKQLRATEAKDRILKLRQEVDNGRFGNEPHDLTLDGIILGYLAVIGNQ